MASAGYSSSSEDDQPVPTPQDGNTATKEFVWLRERVAKVPRGQFWDKLNRDGRVKVLSFKPSWSAKKMWELVLNGFPALSGADVTR